MSLIRQIKDEGENERREAERRFITQPCPEVDYFQTKSIFLFVGGDLRASDTFPTRPFAFCLFDLIYISIFMPPFYKEDITSISAETHRDTNPLHQTEIKKKKCCLVCDALLDTHVHLVSYGCWFFFSFFFFLTSVHQMLSAFLLTW